VTYSFFFQAIVAVASTGDFKGKVSAVATCQVVKSGSFQSVYNQAKKLPF